MVKSSGRPRESERVVVPLIVGRNPARGKGPDFGHNGRAGARQGMAGTVRPNSPEGRVGENRTHGLKGGWGTGSALRTPRS